MSDFENPNIPTVVIKLVPNIGLTIQGPQDRLKCLSLITLAQAMIEREILTPAITLHNGTDHQH